MGLKLYNKKRDFNKTREPKGKPKTTKKHRFVVQEHHATRLHFDFRLEHKGVMKSWAVPKGPSMNPEDKRLAMMVEDHPIDYMYFEGSIPLGEYGGGEVRTWDIGTFEPTGDIEFDDQLRAGKLTFLLYGKKLKGEFHMIHMHGREENAWLMFKTKDDYADPDWEIKRILDYGSRTEAPGAPNAKRKGAKQGESILKKLVSKGRKTSSSATKAKTSTPPRKTAAVPRSAASSPKKRATAAKRRTTKAVAATAVTAKAATAKARKPAKARAAQKTAPPKNKSRAKR